MISKKKKINFQVFFILKIKVIQMYLSLLVQTQQCKVRRYNIYNKYYCCNNLTMVTLGLRALTDSSIGDELQK